jgi:hypothetical protein
MVELKQEEIVDEKRVLLQNHISDLVRTIQVMTNDSMRDFGKANDVNHKQLKEAI